MKERAEIISLEMGADTLTPVLAFLRLRRHGGRAFLLESVEEGEHVGRYSFLGANPFEVLRVRNGKVFLEKNGHEKVLSGNPFHVLGERLSRYTAGKPAPGLPPFQGGAVGFVGYDCVRYLEKLPPRSLPAVHTAEAVFMFFKHIVAFDHLRRRVVIMAQVLKDGTTSRKAARRQARESVEALCKRLRRRGKGETPLLFPHGVPPKLISVRAKMGRAAFCRAVARIKRHIRAGDIFQCVLSERFSFPLEVDPFTVYRTLRALNPSPYMFYVDTGEETLLGASPEMLVRAGEGRVETRPIAGTRPRGGNEKEDKRFERDLLASVKERAEHLMLVDLGRNDVGRTARPGSVRVRDFMHVERFSHVMHLVTRVEGALKKGKTPWEAFAACFPAGTLTGAPKVRAMEILTELEPFRRGAYGGAVVYHDFSGRLDSCITIRSLLVRDGLAYAQAGAGIVADSQALREYREVLHKAAAVRRAATMAEAVEKT